MTPSADEILDRADTILLVDWPSREVPDTLTRGGFAVVVHGGPGPEDFSAYELDHGEVVVRPAGAAPDRADVVYAHRPMDELPGIVALARSVGAATVWHQSGVSPTGAQDPTGCWMSPEASRDARRIVEAAGLAYLDEPYIADVVRRHGRSG